LAVARLTQKAPPVPPARVTVKVAVFVPTLPSVIVMSLMEMKPAGGPVTLTLYVPV
jgi:hypothetical protein